MYYYHLCFSLYSTEFTDLDSFHLFDSSLPTQLVPQQTLDAFDIQYQQQQQQRQQYHHYVDAGTDNATVTHRLHPRKRLRESLPSVDRSLPNIDQLTIGNDPSMQGTSPAASSFNSHDDFRLGPIDIECINNYDNNTGRRLCNLGYGILHLYRDEQPPADDLMPDMLAVMPRTTADDDRGLMTCTLAVPSYMTTDDFLAFVKPFAATVTHYRFIRDAAPNKYIVMMKFDQVQSAYDYHRKFNGRPFHGMEPEICHIVFIASSPTMTTTVVPKYPMLKDTLQTELGDNEKQDDTSQRLGPPPPQTLELPTCPVCLERLDKTVTGLLGIMCQHSFDCDCLGKWGDGNCPVCLFSEKPVLEERRDDDMPRRNLQGWLLSRHASDDRVRCYVCDEKMGSLWICMICGHIGCGRYQAAHAYDHYEDTKTHLFALEIETQRVWDYVGDGYVHRLIQNTVDGKLVEFPGAVTHDGGDGPKPMEQEANGNSNNNGNNTNNMDSSSSSGDGDGGRVDGWHGFEQHSTATAITKSAASPPSSSSLAPTTSSSSTKQTWAAAAAAAGSTTTGTSVQEMNKIEAMSVEYTTLLTSQLDSQRIYFEDQLDALEKQLVTLTTRKSHLDTERTRQEEQQKEWAKQRTQHQHELKTLERAATLLDDQCTTWKQNYDISREKWQHEKTMTNRLSDENEQLKNTLKEKQKQAQDMEEELRDLAFFVQTRNKIQNVPEMVGGSVGTTQRHPPTSSNKTRRGGKKGKR